MYRGVGTVLITAVLCIGMYSSAWAFPTPFINEIHYDNSGADSDEGVEIAGCAGMGLEGWRIILYNGGDGRMYGTYNLSGAIPDLQNGYGVIFFPMAGMQNGSPDGIALIDPNNSTAQFFSYEGFFTAVDGPAAGAASADIGAREDAPIPAAGYALQLAGHGMSYEDFAWSAPQPSSRDMINAGQRFSACEPLPEPATIVLVCLALPGLYFARKR